MKKASVTQKVNRYSFEDAMHHLTKAEKDEVYADSCAAFQAGMISENAFRECLGSLGYNATDIEEAVRFYRPPPAEDEEE